MHKRFPALLFVHNLNFKKYNFYNNQQLAIKQSINVDSALDIVFVLTNEY